MFGDVEDPLFEEHLKEGPYVVLDDSAKDKYKYDPRVVFVPGSPVPQSYIQHEMIDGMGFGMLYQRGFTMEQMATKMSGRLGGMAGPRSRATAWATLAAAGAVAALAITPLVKALRSRHK